MINIKNVNKEYENFKIENLNLNIKRGEFVSILGQSGSGKSTILNIISGSDKSFTGFITIDEKSIQQSIKDGKISMVFQDTLLLPHLSVYENIAFGLKIRKIPKEEIKQRVLEISEKMELKELLDRLPNEISGGQKQRVSIARALVMKPTLLLMDEPFSALDPKLREKLQKLMKDIHKNLSITIIFVTHDRDEAFYLSDKIGIINRGKLVQYDNPIHMYSNPKNTYIAKFLGIENIFTGEQFKRLSNLKFQESKILALRSEDLRITEEITGIEGIIKEIIFKTGFYTIRVEVDGLNIEIKQNRIDFGIYEEKEVYIKFREKDIIHIRGEK
ncbi:ABC transporter ATP-binding protein [Cetobacterium sp. 2A]|uniref:ABC transporter ATP-binding protein n=1 Tax=Cetobacterium sp. 2A TaxID=2754723 RepID=UPI00163CBF80|nr:ABC transporter ATP-binding protein [Cetobacterium sp. 2A]MBC2856702.1 ABC transporter ATP-binding protein [Cetobacterium sp. 2A]